MRDAGEGRFAARLAQADGVAGILLESCAAVPVRLAEGTT